MEEEKKEIKLVEEAEKNKAEAKKEEIKKENENQESNNRSKKSETITKGDNKKANQHVMVIGIIAVVIAFVAILIAISFGKDTPKKVVENTLSDIKKGTYAQEMLSNLVQGEDNFDAEAQKLLFEKLDWKILNVKEEGEKATVEIEITNKDFKTIMGNYMQKALKAAFSGQTVSEDEMTNYLMEELRNEEIQSVTSNQEITLEKQDGKWKITDDENFINSILPGLYEAISAFN